MECRHKKDERKREREPKYRFLFIQHRFAFLNEKHLAILHIDGTLLL